MKKNFCAQWCADRRLTEQDEGTPSFDWNHGKNGRAKGTKKVRAQNLNYFVFLLFLNFLWMEFAIMVECNGNQTHKQTKTQNIL